MFGDKSNIYAYENDTEFTKNYPNDRLLTRKEAAEYLGFKENTLAIWDCKKRHDLKPLKIGRTVRYRLSVLHAFLLESMRP